MVVEFDSTVAPPAWIISFLRARRKNKRGGVELERRSGGRFRKDEGEGEGGRMAKGNLQDSCLVQCWQGAGVEEYSAISGHRLFPRFPPPPRRFVTDGYERKFEKL